MSIALGLASADAVGILTTLYWVCLIVGGGLLAFSMLGGTGHGNADVSTGIDVHVDAGADVDLGATDVAHAGPDFHVEHGALGGLSSWFSIRFLVFFLAVFGAVGVVLTHLSPLDRWLTLAFALAGGAAVGQVVHQVLRLVRRTSGNSTPQPQDYVNRLGRVTIAIARPDKGEVVIQVRGTERFVPGVAVGPEVRFSVGDEVVVVGYLAGVAQVVSKQEFERRARGG